MKILFERWRRYLNEVDPYAETPLAKPLSNKTSSEDATHSYPRGDVPEETRERYFGANPENLQCIQDLRKPPELRSVNHRLVPVNIPIRANNFYNCMEAAGWKRIGAGSFRTVFSIPGKPNLVLKTPNPNFISKSPYMRRQSIEMNKKEAQGAFQTTSDLVVKVYDSAEDYFWIISEKVFPIDDWIEMSEYFPIWKELEKEGFALKEEFGLYFQDFIKALKRKDPESNLPGDFGIKNYVIRLFKKKFRTREMEELQPYMAEIDKFTNKLLRNSMFANIRDLLAKFNLPEWDIRPHNVGYAMRNGKKQFVIIDPGFVLDDIKFNQQDNWGFDP